MKLRRGQRVQVDWFDAFGFSGWKNLREVLYNAKKKSTVRSVGKFVFMDNEKLVIAAGIHGEHLQRPGLIWRRDIKKIRKLK